MRRYNIAFFFFFLLGSASLLQAGHNYNDYIKRAKQHFYLLDEIYNKYPMAESTKKLAIVHKLKKNWENILSEYKQVRAKERNQILLQMKEKYIQLYSILRETCIQLSRYSNDILIDYSQRIKNKELKGRQKDIYENSFQVAKYEMHRARNAFMGEQFNYSTKLYHRSIIIIANTYKKLNWAVPSTYEKVQTNSVDNKHAYHIEIK